MKENKRILQPYGVPLYRTRPFSGTSALSPQDKSNQTSERARTWLTTTLSCLFLLVHRTWTLAVIFFFSGEAKQKRGMLIRTNVQPTMVCFDPFVVLVLVSETCL